MKLFTGICSLSAAVLLVLLLTAEPESAWAQGKDAHASIPALTGFAR